MYCCIKINDDIIWIGINDRKIERFENYIFLDNGVIYNLYLIMDEKICIVDGVEEGENGNFLSKIEVMIGNFFVDYIIVNYVEFDYFGLIKNMLKIYLELKVVGNVKIIMMLKLLGFDLLDERVVIVKEKDILDLGKYKLIFYLMFMVYWFELMVIYDIIDKVLFLNDVFGSFGVLDGVIFDDEVNIDFFIDEMRRYYLNIVGKFGVFVNVILKKLFFVEIFCICFFYGLIWRKYIKEIIERY